VIQICYSKHHAGPGKVFGEKEPFEDLSLTSGICEDCFPEELKDLEEWKSSKLSRPNTTSGKKEEL